MPTYSFNGRECVVDLPLDETILKPVRVFFPGTGGTASTYKTQINAAFTDSYVVYLTASGTTPTWRTDVNAVPEVAYINWVLQELKLLHPNMDIDDIQCNGHSNGGTMACTFGHYEPVRVKSIVMTNSYVSQNTTNFSGKVRHIWAQDDNIIPPDGGTYPSVFDTRAVFIAAGADYLLIGVNGDHTLASVKQGLSEWGTSLEDIISGGF